MAAFNTCATRERASWLAYSLSKRHFVWVLVFSLCSMKNSKTYMKNGYPVWFDIAQGQFTS